jgi:hypothetical protein
MVFCDGFFYFLALNQPNDVVIVGFSLADGTSIYAPLPLQLLDTPGIRALQRVTGGSRVLFVLNTPGIRAPQMVTSVSRVLFVTGMGLELGFLQEVIIWEFQRAERKWEEIARMVPSMSENGISHFKWFECVEVGDCVCFRNWEVERPGDMEVVVYNLRQKPRSRLPSCPISNNSTAIRLKSMSFEPRPNMKID